MKMTIKTPILTALLFASVCICSLASCTSSGERETEETEGIVADEVAAQIEGRRAAKEFARRAWPDSLELRDSIYSTRQRFAGLDSLSRVETDSAFIKTLHAVRPGIARFAEQLPPNRQ